LPSSLQRYLHIQAVHCLLVDYFPVISPEFSSDEVLLEVCACTVNSVTIKQIIDSFNFMINLILIDLIDEANVFFK
jgi:hypothetical protein